MKITETTMDVTRSGAFQERSFGIEANAKAFDILSSKIYTNVPLAIVRELSTNASDSHTDAGCPDKPFDVHLPNTLEPWFAIRDYGTGLSPEDVETVYTTYFKSTRSGSDDFTGCLGLGSKSPFAYTDQFTIISTWACHKYTYSAFKNEQGRPSLALLADCVTDEANGLEIKINIKPYESGNFVEAASKVYHFFRVKPNISGAKITLFDLKAEICNSNFTLFPSSYDIDLPRITVVMGQVGYVADKEADLGRLGHSGSLIINMPMGSCSISASREELQYDPRTIKNVQAAIDNAITESKTELESRFANEKTLLAKLGKMSRFRGLISGLSAGGLQAIPQEEKDKYTTRKISIRRGNKLYIDNYHNGLGGSDEDAVFIEQDAEDLTQNIKNRIRQYISGKNNSAYLCKIQDIVRFNELFGEVTIKLSNLPDVPRQPRNTTRTASRSKPIKLMKDSCYGSMNEEWEVVMDANAIDSTNACAVIRDGTWVMFNGEKVKPDYVRKIAHALGFERIYGISDKRFTSTLSKHGLENLQEIAKDRTEKLIKSLDIYTLSRFQHGDAPRNLPYNKMVGLSQECDDLINVFKAKVDEMQTYQTLGRIFNIEIPKAPDYKKTFMTRYRLLAMFDLNWNTIDSAPVIEYIKLIESA
jgi:hypothetical protein